MGAGPPADFWPPNKHVLNVRFLNGTEDYQRTVKSLVKKHYHSIPMRIRFKFLSEWDTSPSDIRISFADESKAYIGRQAENHPGEPTMWLNMHPRWLTGDDARKKVQGDVLHEFGHALGLIHEQKHPQRKLRWNYSRLMERYQLEYDAAHRNYAASTTSALNAEWDRPYDPKSIMHYPIAKGDTQSMGTEVPENYVLSDGDKQALVQIYPSTAVVKQDLTVRKEEKKKEEKKKEEKKREERKTKETAKKDKNVGHLGETHIGGNRSAVVCGGYVTVSGNADAIIHGGGYVVASGNSDVIVHGDSTVWASGNADVYVNGGGSASASGNATVRFTGRGTGQATGNASIYWKC
ncbi:predicted protein [Aspergillus terreus NIH2624]|uniref:Peptidase metallopeptidase domain-containing protein n=1 Tax=Aspergillus terreus (strain NIH 2624 / FGSC A1156) TaxID=341663 RepID=Q0CBJ8_ASPTN|nr:uncharacterized protein ATEG_08936 [Aspergillus terreus NIH2624]EAU31068.1 predicted protein [Aspergillus terreus NIH2624]